MKSDFISAFHFLLSIMPFQCAKWKISTTCILSIDKGLILLAINLSNDLAYLYSKIYQMLHVALCGIVYDSPSDIHEEHFPFEQLWFFYFIISIISVSLAIDHNVIENIQ